MSKRSSAAGRASPTEQPPSTTRQLEQMRGLITMLAQQSERLSAEVMASRLALSALLEAYPAPEAVLDAYVRAIDVASVVTEDTPKTFALSLRDASAGYLYVLRQSATRRMGE